MKPYAEKNEDAVKKMNSLSSLKKLALKGSAWSILGFAVGQGMRLIGNVVVAGMLYPEAFGMMAIVNAILMGLAMFSDLGLRPSIIQSKRGEDPLFLCTAWSIQVIRGIVLALFAFALAWPLALLNNEPQLFYLISVTGLTSIFTGFNSTWMMVYSRRLDLNKVVLLNIFTSFVGTATMIIWAYFHPTVWALVSSAFVSVIIKLVVSHTLLAGVPMKLSWDKAAVSELIKFGRWIFISTALGFLLARLDVFILGSFAGMTVLGFYSLAKTFSRLSIDALMQLSNMVLLPVYSRLKERGKDTLRQNTFKARALLLILFLPPLWILVLWGEYLIGLLYDDRYQEAGWMLKVLSAGAIATVIMFTINPVLLAVGDSFRNMLNTISRTVFQGSGMLIGAYFWGVEGFIIGLALGDLLNYPILAYLVRPYGVWLPSLDIVAFSSSAVVLWIAFGLG